MAVNYSPKIVTDGLVLYLDAANTKSYPGSGTTWTDISRDENNGTLINGPTFSSANGGSILFDGVDDYSIISQNLGNFSNNPMTIEMWIYPTDIPVNGRILLMDKPNYYDLYGLEIFIFDGGGYKIGIRGSGTNLASTNACLTLNQWQHIIISFSNTTAYAYVNSIQIGTGLTIDTMQQSSYPLYIGTYTTIPGYNFSGRMSIVKIYNKLLSNTEVLQNFNATKTRFGL